MRNHRLAIFLILLALAIIGALALRVQAQNPALKPPVGAKLALVVFEDLQCSDCANASPLLHQAQRDHKIPLVVYDFPLPKHNWAFDAAVIARYFETKSEKLGDEFRTYIFEHQPEITKDNLRTFAEQFGLEHKSALPTKVDPQGKLAAAVQADLELGKNLGITHTPTIYVVTNKKTGTPFVEVVNRSDLYAMIDELKKELD